jgi:hypothetical protein
MKTGLPFSGSASYYVTFSGNPTFTAAYRTSAAGTVTIDQSQIIVQVIS